MIGYLVIRFGFAVLVAFHIASSIGWRIEVLFWFAFGIYLIVACSRWSLSKLRS